MTVGRNPENQLMWKKIYTSEVERHETSFAAVFTPTFTVWKAGVF